MQSKRTIISCALLKSLLDSSLSYAINFYDAHAHAHVGKWVTDELRAFTSSTDHDETRVRNRRKGDSVEDVVTVRNSDEGIKDESTSSIATNSDEDASTASSNNSSGIMFVSNSKDCGTSSSWSRYQQKQLEWALVQYPKFAKDRWENIAKAVPGKSKVHT